MPNKVRNLTTRIAELLQERIGRAAARSEEAYYKALREAQPTYTNVESATKASEGLADRGLPSRGVYPGTEAAHEKAVRGTVADLSRPEVMPSIGSWTEEGVNYTNPGSSVNLGKGIREFGGYGGPIPPELAQAAGALQQTGAGMSRFTPGKYDRPVGFFSDVEFKTQPTKESMSRALGSLTPMENYARGGAIPDALYGRFLQHIPQEGVVRGHSMTPEDVRFLQEVFGAKPRYGRADTVYNEAYPLEATHRGLLE
jgi:hypothetical protein